MSEIKKITNNLNLGILLKALIAELVSAILYFPVIYYSTGVRHVFKKLRGEIFWYERFFAIRLSARTLTTPLYGDYTWSGYIIGFFMRLLLLVARTVGFSAVVSIILFLFVLYLAAPVAVIYLFIFAEQALRFL